MDSIGVLAVLDWLALDDRTDQPLATATVDPREKHDYRPGRVASEALALRGE